jgi:hypothetical protein
MAVVGHGRVSGHNSAFPAGSLAALSCHPSNTVSQVGPDKYRARIDAAVATRDTPDVAAALLKGGFARS